VLPFYANTHTEGFGRDLTCLMCYVPPGLGYYGLDLYGNVDIRKHPRWKHPLDRWIQFTELARTKDEFGYPWLAIGEMNWIAPASSLQWREQGGWPESGRCEST
jgi:hypothetical protein